VRRFRHAHARILRRPRTRSVIKPSERVGPTRIAA
jgi:hypothetical protein